MYIYIYISIYIYILFSFLFPPFFLFLSFPLFFPLVSLPFLVPLPPFSSVPSAPMFPCSVFVLPLPPPLSTPLYCPFYCLFSFLFFLSPFFLCAAPSPPPSLFLYSPSLVLSSFPCVIFSVLSGSYFSLPICPLFRNVLICAYYTYLAVDMTF